MGARGVEWKEGPLLKCLMLACRHIRPMLFGIWKNKITNPNNVFQNKGKLKIFLSSTVSLGPDPAWQHYELSGAAIMGNQLGCVENTWVPIGLARSHWPSFINSLYQLYTTKVCDQLFPRKILHSSILTWAVATMKSHDRSQMVYASF